MKKRYWLLLALGAIFIGLITFNADKIMKAVWEFRDGFMGVPRR